MAALDRRGAEDAPSGCATRAPPTSPAVRAHLDAVGRRATGVEPALVRGLDYYTRTAFEFYRRGARGPAAGARRRRPLRRPGGAARRQADAGDRLRPRARPRRPRPRERRRGARRGAAPIAVVVGADPADTAGRLAVATRLRDAGLAVRADLSPRKLGRQLEAAVKEGAHFAVILGDELAAGDVQLRDLDGGVAEARPARRPRGPPAPEDARRPDPAGDPTRRAAGRLTAWSTIR